jgi:hypothetical protein
VVFVGLAATSLRPAWAGCGDGACGRVDWTEVTETRGGNPVAVKFHGGYAWESSPDFWATHPLGGKISGYLWLTCTADGDPQPACLTQLNGEMAKAGTDTPIKFNGSYFSQDAGVVRPPGLFEEGESAAPERLQLGGGPINAQICPTAFALPENGQDGGTTTADAGATSDDAGSSDDARASEDAPSSTGSGGAGGSPGSGGSTAATGGSTVGSGGAAGATSATGGGTNAAGAAGGKTDAADAGDEDGGCSLAPRAPRSTPAFAAIGLVIGLAMRRRRRYR